MSGSMVVLSLGGGGSWIVLVLRGAWLVPHRGERVVPHLFWAMGSFGMCLYGGSFRGWLFGGSLVVAMAGDRGERSL